MLLKESVPEAEIPVPLRDFARHLRLAHGFSDDGSEDGLLEFYLRNASAVIEARTGRALIERPYSLQVAGWDRRGHLTLPVGPVKVIDRISIVRAGTAVELGQQDWVLEPGHSRQRLTGSGGAALRPLPHGAVAELAFNAGYGPEWSDVPGDLRQAVMLLAAHFYENRYGELESDVGLPASVRAVIEPHRPTRL